MPDEIRHGECLPSAWAAAADSAAEAIQRYYDHPTESSRTGDEFITATTVTGDGRGLVRDGDAVIFLNYRGDRTREITKAFVLPDDQWQAIDGGGFDRGKRIENLFFATMTGYEGGLPVHVIFEKRAKMPDILGQYVSELGLRQFRCAETEKYPHVTYFFNGGEETPFENEDRCLVPSPRDVATYDHKPEMSARQVAAEVVARLESNTYDFIVLNFANMDMVGHTGVMDAAVHACETVDRCLEKVIVKLQGMGGVALVTADHGNSEKMATPGGKPHTAHTTNPVRLLLVSDDHKAVGLREGRLGDIAPTFLDLMGLEKPTEMTGNSLLVTG